MAKEVHECPVCSELSSVWVNSEEYWCHTCGEPFPVHVNSPEWIAWYQRKFGRRP